MHDEITAAYTELTHTLGSVKLLAVSKQQPLAALRWLYDLGQRFFAENYVQEAIQKKADWSPPDVEWHFIGTIQSNKTALIAENFDWVQTVDRDHIAQRLSARCVALKKELQVCIALNVDAEPSKSGVAVNEVLNLAQRIQALPQLRLRGLMVIPRRQDDYKQQLATFKKVRLIFEELRQQEGSTIDTLSMGMSHDYKAAIEAGSTMVRVGTLLFGSRVKRDDAL